METNELLATILTKLEALEAGQSATNDRLDGMERKLETIDSKLGHVETGVKKIEITLENTSPGG